MSLNLELWKQRGFYFVNDPLGVLLTNTVEEKRRFEKSIKRMLLIGFHKNTCNKECFLRKSAFPLELLKLLFSYLFPEYHLDDYYMPMTSTNLYKNDDMTTLLSIYAMKRENIHSTFNPLRSLKDLGHLNQGVSRWKLPGLKRDDTVEFFDKNTGKLCHSIKAKRCLNDDVVFPCILDEQTDFFVEVRNKMAINKMVLIVTRPTTGQSSALFFDKKSTEQPRVEIVAHTLPTNPLAFEKKVNGLRDAIPDTLNGRVSKVKLEQTNSKLVQWITHPRCGVVNAKGLFEDKQLKNLGAFVYSNRSDKIEMRAFGIYSDLKRWDNCMFKATCQNGLLVLNCIGNEDGLPKNEKTPEPRATPWINYACSDDNEIDDDHDTKSYPNTRSASKKRNISKLLNETVVSQPYKRFKPAIVKRK